MQQQASNQGATNAAGTSLDIHSEEFRRPTSIGTMWQDRQININSKEFMPSRGAADQVPAPRNTINVNQIKELLAFQETINAKIKKAQEAQSKVRLDDLLDDENIKVQNEYVEDQIRIICNNTVRGNFKQKIEELKKYVVKKPPQIGEDGKEVFDEYSAKADDHLMWFIHYVLTKRLGSQS